MTGSITATFKAFIEAVLLQPLQVGSDRIAWPEVVPAHEPAVSGCPHRGTTQPSFPHYDAAIATQRASVRRGSLDVIYRKYEGRVETKLGKTTIQPQDLVIVWLGGTLNENPDNVFGIGVHKCPGMDMAKAILDGVMGVLTQLRGPDAPRRRPMDADLALIFDNVDAVKSAGIKH